MWQEISLAMSMVSLIATSYIAQRQMGWTSRTNETSVVASFFKEMRSAEFFMVEERLWKELGKHKPSQGFSGLPDEVRERAYEVAYYYLTLAYMVDNGILDPVLTVKPFHYRLGRTWATIEPFVNSERSSETGNKTFLRTLELFSVYVREMHGRQPGRASRLEKLTRRYSIAPIPHQSRLDASQKPV